MEHTSDGESLTIRKQLIELYKLRLTLEARQQVILSRSVYLSRFIRLASLDRIRNAPEMDQTRSFIRSVFSDRNLKGTLREFQVSFLLQQSLKEKVN